jgi:hypothetical protein
LGRQEKMVRECPPAAQLAAVRRLSGLAFLGIITISEIRILTSIATVYVRPITGNASTAGELRESSTDDRACKIRNSSTGVHGGMH